MKTKLLLQTTLTAALYISIGLMIAATIAAPILLTESEIIQFWSEILK